METTYLILNLLGCLCGAVTVIGWTISQFCGPAVDLMTDR